LTTLAFEQSTALRASATHARDSTARDHKDEKDDKYASGFHDDGDDTMMDWADDANDGDAADSPPN
jgi:hypothetical protein